MTIAKPTGLIFLFIETSVRAVTRSNIFSCVELFWAISVIIWFGLLLLTHNFQVFEKLKLAEKTSVDIDKLRDGYRPAAKRGAILFFVLAEMALVNSMYQYSLASYLEVFDFSLRKSLPDSVLPKRLKNIMDTLTYNVYNYGCTGEWHSGLLFGCYNTVTPTFW